MEESDTPHFFKKTNIARMKLFLEGEGYAIDEKYKGTAI
jgi:hypothetical protein